MFFIWSSFLSHHPITLSYILFQIMFSSYNRQPDFISYAFGHYDRSYSIFTVCIAHPITKFFMFIEERLCSLSGYRFATFLAGYEWLGALLKMPSPHIWFITFNTTYWAFYYCGISYFGISRRENSIIFEYFVTCWNFYRRILYS